MGDGDYVEEEIAKAERAPDDAKQLASGTGSDEGVVNRPYYASFHAAQAVLCDRDVNPSSHGAVRQLFGEEVVLEGAASREQGRLLTTLADLRQQADYGYEPIEADVSELLIRTEQFVEVMAALLEQ